MEIDLDNLMYSNVEILVSKGNGFEENPIIQHAFIEFLKVFSSSPCPCLGKKEKHGHHKNRPTLTE